MGNNTMNEATLRAKVATLAAENRKLKRVAKHSKTDSLLTRVKKDALQLLAWRFSGFAISRRLCEEAGMTQRRWQWARSLLHYARVMDGQEITAMEFTSAVEAVESATRILESRGIEQLRIRLPQHVALSNSQPSYRYRQKAKGTAKGTAKGMAAGVAVKPVQKLAASRENPRGGGDGKTERTWKIEGGPNE